VLWYLWELNYATSRPGSCNYIYPAFHVQVNSVPIRCHNQRTFTTKRLISTEGTFFGTPCIYKSDCELILRITPHIIVAIVILIFSHTCMQILTCQFIKHCLLKECLNLLWLVWVIFYTRNCIYPYLNNTYFPFSTDQYYNVQPVQVLFRWSKTKLMEIIPAHYPIYLFDLTDLAIITLCHELRLQQRTYTEYWDCIVNNLF
jgi:hypothetical protein